MLMFGLCNFRIKTAIGLVPCYTNLLLLIIIIIIEKGSFTCNYVSIVIVIEVLILLLYIFLLPKTKPVSGAMSFIDRLVAMAFSRGISCNNENIIN